MDKLRTAFLLTITITLAGVLASMLLPTPATWIGSDQSYHLRLAIALFIPALHVLAAIFFFRGLTGFKEEFRTAYSLIAVGVIIIGIALLASPMVTIFDLWDSWAMELGVINLPFVFAVVTIFAGIRTFYRKLDVQTIWRSMGFNIAFVLAGLVLAVFMPHARSLLPELRYDIGSVFFALSSLTLLVTAFNILPIRKQIAPNYARVLTWLGGGLIFEAVLVGMSLVLKAFGIDVRQASGGLQDTLILAAIPYLVSGYLFYQLTADIRRGLTKSGGEVIDVVMYVSSLVSSRKAIDTILDEVRLITARRHPGDPIGDADKAKLADVYLKLEKYLATEEKLRSFTAEQLRRQMYTRFYNQASATVDTAFWQKLPQLKATAPVAPVQTPAAQH